MFMFYQLCLRLLFIILLLIFCVCAVPLAINRIGNTASLGNYHPIDMKHLLTILSTTFSAVGKQLK